LAILEALPWRCLIISTNSSITQFQSSEARFLFYLDPGITDSGSLTPGYIRLRLSSVLCGIPIFLWDFISTGTCWTSVSKPHLSLHGHDKRASTVSMRLCNAFLDLAMLRNPTLLFLLSAPVHPLPLYNGSASSCYPQSHLAIQFTTPFLLLALFAAVTQAATIPAREPDLEARCICTPEGCFGVGCVGPPTHGGRDLEERCSGSRRREPTCPPPQ
jgi:hypothetical protein